LPRTPRREIRRHPTFERRAESLGIGARRLDAVLLDLEATISLDAESDLFPRIPGTALRAGFTRPALGVPALRVFFEITSDELVTLWSIDTLP
jgi:hypothetical protein